MRVVLVPVLHGATDKGTKIIYAAADDGTNPNIIDVGMGRCNSCRNTNFNKQNFNKS